MLIKINTVSANFNNTAEVSAMTYIIYITHPTVSTNPIIDLFLSPGFPLTLRLENPIQESLASVSSFGHPVVDTTGAIGQG